MMVLIGIGNYAYCLEDSFYVEPIGCLKECFDSLPKILRKNRYVKYVIYEKMLIFAA